MRAGALSLFSALLGIATAASAPKAVNVHIKSETTHPISPTLYGYMYEDISHSGDGGLYAELLQNRAFQAVTPGTTDALTAWESNSCISLDVVNNTAGVSKALPNSLKVFIPAAAKGSVSFSNTGYWGFKVQSGWQYNGTFYARSDNYTGSVTVSLRSNSTSKPTTYATARPVKALSGNWTKYEYTFKPTKSAPDASNIFSVELEATGKAETVFFGLFTLFPPTFKNRVNGMRIDIAETMAGTTPRVWRFPGGNNIEGHEFASRWKWNETIGPLENRPGRFANWGYPNTDGLGLIEYLNWADDLNMTVILGVWSGIAVGDYSNLPTWPVVPENDLAPYIQEAIDEIHFITDAANASKWGALRAQYGRPEPYPLKYVEIGNEDNFQAASYQAYRWPMFATALKKEFPDIELLATTLPSTALNPKYTKIDYHQYQGPSWFLNMTSMWNPENYPRNGTQFFVGEYAMTSLNDTNALGTPSDGRLVYPTIQGASVEAAFMTGMERNSDVVFASAYAPTLANLNSVDWTPNLLTFDALDIVRSASYYTQKMFTNNLGTDVLASDPPNTDTTAPLYFVASKGAGGKTAILKVSNPSAAPIKGTFTTDFTASSPAHGMMMTGPAPAAYNTLDKQNVVVPKNMTFSVQNGKKVSATFPAYSVTVMTFNVKKWW